MKIEQRKPDELQTHFSAAGMAYVLGISTRRLQELAHEGVAVKSGRGAYLIETVKRYVEYREGLAELKAAKPDSPLQLERLRRMRRENDEADENLILRDEAVETISGIVDDVRNGLVSIPSLLKDISGIEKAQLQSCVNRVSETFDSRARKVLERFRTGRDVFDDLSVTDEIN